MKLAGLVSGLPDKDRILLRNTLGAFAVRGAALVLSLFTMPAYMRFFSDQQMLGVWFTILSILSWILNFDLGIGNGLRNNLAKVISLKDRKSAKEYVSSAYWILGFVVLAIFVLGSIATPFANWNGLFNISPDILSKADLKIVVFYSFSGIMIQFYLRLISSVLYAMQKSAWNNFIGLFISALQLLFVSIVTSVSSANSVKMMSIAYIFTTNIPLIAATLMVFLGPMRDCRPDPRFFRKDKAKGVLSLGGIFFLCQVLYMLISNTNQFFITQYTQPANVVEYHIYNSLFSLGSMLFMLMLTPVWSTVSKAVAENDFFWLRKLRRNLSRLAWVAILVEFLLIPFLQPIMNFWLKERSISVNYFYAVSFALFGSAMIYQSSVSTIACGTGRLKVQAYSYFFGIIAKIFIIHYGIALTGSWIVVVLANVIILIPYCVLQHLDIRQYIRFSLQQEG